MNGKITTMFDASDTIATPPKIFFVIFFHILKQENKCTSGGHRWFEEYACGGAADRATRQRAAGRG